MTKAMTATKTEFNLSQEIVELLMQGGQIIWSKENEWDKYKGNQEGEYKPFYQALIRMPKGRWIPDNRGGELYKNNSFEYVVIGNYGEDNDVRVKSKRNDHLKTMKNIMRSEWNDNYYTFRTKCSEIAEPIDEWQLNAEAGSC